MDGHLHDERPLDRAVGPLQAHDDYGLVPASVAVPAQLLLEALLGDEPFDLAAAAALMARVADATSEGMPADERWTGHKVLARCRELVELYNPPPELGGDIPSVPDRWAERTRAESAVAAHS